MSNQRLSPAILWAIRRSAEDDSKLRLVFKVFGASLAIILVFFWGFCAIGTLIFILASQDRSLVALQEFIVPDVVVLAITGVPVGILYGLANWFLLMRTRGKCGVSLSEFVNMSFEQRRDVLTGKS